MTDAETAPSADTPASPPPRRRRWPLVVLAAALLLALAGVGGVLAWPRVAALLAPPPAGPSPQELAGRVDTLQAELTATRQRVDALQAELAKLQPLAKETATAPAPGQLAVPAAPAAIAPAASPALARQVADLDGRLALLEKNAAAATTVLHLSDRMDQDEAALRRMQARRHSAGALLLAVALLRDEVDLGQPFDGELRLLKELAGQDPDVAQALAALRPRAAAGIPGRPALAARFQALEPAIIRAEALPAGDGWWRRTMDRLMTLVTIRREDGSALGDGAAAVAARVQARLAAGDLGAAVAQAAHLSGPPAQVAAPWLADARARLAADKALSALTAKAVAASAAGR